MTNLAELPVRLLQPEQYRPQASAAFENEKMKLQRALSEAVIEHIGSSSVPGLLSKGDLDVLVAVPSKRVMTAVAELLALGYEINVGSLRTDELCPFIAVRAELDIGVQLIAKDSRFEFFRTFRDSLIESPPLRHAYNEVKRRSAPLGQTAYRKAKSGFIEELLNGTR